MAERLRDAGLDVTTDVGGRDGRAIRRYLRHTLGRHKVTTLHAAIPYSTFTPDERAIGHGVRAMAGWLAGRTG